VENLAAEHDLRFSAAGPQWRMVLGKHQCDCRRPRSLSRYAVQRRMPVHAEPPSLLFDSVGGPP
jgi:hypothetical protein